MAPSGDDVAKQKKAKQQTKQKEPGAPAAAAPSPAPPAPRAAPAPAASAALRPLVVDERLLFMVIALAVGAWFVWQVRDVLPPLLFVAVVTFVGAPFVEKLVARGLPRIAAAGVFIALLIGFFAALIAIVVPPLVTDVSVLLEKMPALLLRGADLVEKHTGMQIPTSVKELSGQASKELLEQLSPFAAKGGALVGAGAVGIARGAASAAGFLGKVLLVPITTFFLLAELPEVRRFVRDLASPRARAISDRYLPLVDDALSGLVRGQLTVVAVMCVIYVVGLGFSGVPLAVGIGILAGFAYLIPFASATVALVLSVAFTLLEKGTTSYTPYIGAIVTCVLVQIVESYVLTPRIVGEKAGLSPLAAMLAVLLGGSAAGFLGVLFALPAGAVIALVLREEVLQRRSHAEVG